MKNIFFRREGQIAPFMIAIIVVLIMALMVTANIGKVGITKTHTANAADAGALAGSTTHANTLNNLAYTNESMIAEYLGTEVMFLVLSIITIEYVRFLTYWSFVVAQTAQFTLAWINADRGYRDARSAAQQFAFMNSGIDEVKERSSGESYEAYLERESRFGQWMKDKGYESGVYAWSNKQGGQNSFSVNVDAPGFPGLIPMPSVFVSFYYMWLPPCVGPVCAACVAAQVLFEAGVAAARRGTLSTSFVIMRGVCPPGGFALASVIYFVPIAWIGGIVEDNPKLTVTTTRLTPNSDLGLWEMKYGSISSAAKSESKGGSVGPAPSYSYESYLTSGGY